MKKNLFSHSFSIGLAIFSMFFGAGNVIFPLAVGQYAQDKNIFALSGLILTVAVMPIIGVIAMILYEGNYKQFFGRLGKVPGFIMALIIISLLGPLGSTPRCIALAYTTINHFFPFSPVIFSALTCGVIFLFSFKKTHILTLLGWVLTPLLLLSLTSIILIGLFTEPSLQPFPASNAEAFFFGLKEGYNTMDLLAAFFFSSTILNLLRSRSDLSPKNHGPIALRASLIGAVLLSVIYVGLSYLAAFHGSQFIFLSKDQLLSAITMKIAGPKAGILVCITIALTCLTTAIALITAFTDFIQKEVFKEKMSYVRLLSWGLLVTFCVSTFRFSGISAFLSPILEICYPGLILLTFLNIAYRLKNIQPIKTPVFLAFFLAGTFYFFT